MTVWKQLDKAIMFAAMAHKGQVRKYTGLPYVTHTVEVMTILHETAAIVSEDQLCAALLHDVVEDTEITIETIELQFGPGVAALVHDLTDVFTSERYGYLNRRARKYNERIRLSRIASQAQDIKLADLISNTTSIAEYDPGFARVYLAEKAAILDVMVDGDRALMLRAREALWAGEKRLVQHALEKST